MSAAPGGAGCAARPPQAALCSEPHGEEPSPPLGGDSKMLTRRGLHPHLPSIRLDPTGFLRGERPISTS